MNLFQIGKFSLASGKQSNWKIECDSLSDEDWKTLALIAYGILPEFSEVIGVPTGGLKFAKHLQHYATKGPILIADDVLTTGKSMEVIRGERDAIGIVAFARGGCPPWIAPIFQMKEGDLRLRS